MKKRLLLFDILLISFLCFIPTNAFANSAIKYGNVYSDTDLAFRTYGTYCTPMPTMTIWGGIAMAAVLGLLVVYMVRRRQTVPEPATIIKW